jgi:hypothetical protein
MADVSMDDAVDDAPLRAASDGGARCTRTHACGVLVTRR